VPPCLARAEGPRVRVSAPHPSPLARRARQWRRAGGGPLLCWGRPRPRPLAMPAASSLHWQGRLLMLAPGNGCYRLAQTPKSPGACRPGRRGPRFIEVEVPFPAEWETGEWGSGSSGSARGGPETAGVTGTSTVTVWQPERRPGRGSGSPRAAGGVAGCAAAAADLHGTMLPVYGGLAAL
jgi:hypothetical protein